MKHLYTLLLQISFFGISFSQVPVFFKDGARWTYSTNSTPDSPPPYSWETTTQHIIHGDTLLNGTYYHRLFTTKKIVYRTNGFPPFMNTSYDSIGPEFIRHDPLLNRVYFLPATSSTERLLFDFNAAVGDTIAGQGLSIQWVVDSFITDRFMDDSVRYIYFHGTNSNGNEQHYFNPSYGNYIIEGLGGANGLLSMDPIFASLSGGTFTSLVCFQLGDSIYPSGADCPFLDFISGINELEFEALRIDPNPSNGFITIQLNVVQSSEFDILVYSLDGRKMEGNYSLGRLSAGIQSHSLNLSELSSGFYLLECRNREGSVFKKLVISR